MRANDQRMAEVRAGGRAAGWPRSSRTTRRSSSRCAPPSTRSCTRRSSSASARASARWPSGSSRCTAASARCRSWRSDVGSLSRVLNNVKTRGVLGEVQLAGLLEQVFTRRAVRDQRRDRAGQRRARRVRDQAARAGATTASRSGCRSTASSRARTTSGCSRRRSEADRPASRRPGGRSRSACASRRGRSARSTSRRRTPPTSASCSCRPRASMPRRCAGPAWSRRCSASTRSCSTGPTTLLATLTSLQMGFRTLALEKRSSEVWEMLGAVKTEFGKFGAGAREHAQEAPGGEQDDRRGRGAHPRHGAQPAQASRRCRTRAPRAAAGPARRRSRRRCLTARRRPRRRGCVRGRTAGRCVAPHRRQIALHSCMAGVRMAAPLAVLREGHAAWAVGVLLGLFAAAPIVARARRRPARRPARLPPADPASPSA